MQNLSSFEIVYGHKLPTIKDLQLEGCWDEHTYSAFYHFSDYLYLLNECNTRHCERKSQLNHPKKITTAWFGELYTMIFEWGWHSLLSFSIKYYYLWPKTAIQNITNVICWTTVHFFQTWQIHVSPIYHRWRGHWKDVSCIMSKEGSVEIAEW